MNEIFIFLYKFYCNLIFFGLEIMMIIFRMRPFDDALEEYEQVMKMDFVSGIIQLFLNNEKYYK